MSDDLISRQAALEIKVSDGYNVDGILYVPFKDVYKHLKTISSVHPEQKTGRWIYTNTIGGMRYYGCTICTNQEKDCIADENEIQWYNYCPNCGAFMKG